MRKIFIGILLLTLWSGEMAAAQANKPDADISTDRESIASIPGTYEKILPGKGRRYSLIIPNGYTGKNPVPLVMSLHYGGEVTPFYGRGLLETLIEPALRDLGAIMVGPDCVSRGWANADARAHVLELLDYVQANYNIDPGRVLLTGVSMGGMGTWYLAPRHPDRFRLAIPISGRPQDDSTEMDWQTPMYIIHSRADEIVPIAPTEEAVDKLRAKGASIKFVVVDEITHFEFPKLLAHLKDAIPWISENWRSE